MAVATARAGRAERIRRHDPDTGHDVWQLTRSDEASFHSYYDLCPWNAAGDKIVFCAVAPGRGGSDVYWMDTAGGTLHLVGHSARQNPHTGVHQQWVGREDVLAYEDEGPQGPFVRLVSLGDGEVGRLPGTARMLSPDGTLVASHTLITDEGAISRRDEAGVFVAPVGAGGDGPAPRLIASLQDALERNPRRESVQGCHLYVKHAKFSPDGSRLMFVFTNEILYEGRDGGTRVKDLYVVNADGTGLRFVCPFTWGNHPSWHPNGRQLFFNGRYGRGGSAERVDPLLFLLADVETGSVSPATHLAAGGGHPLLSPDGRRIGAEYVDRKRGTARVVSVDLDRERVDVLARFSVRDHSHQGTHIHPTWSRDGRQLLFNVDESGHSELWVAPATMGP